MDKKSKSSETKKNAKLDPNMPPPAPIEPSANESKVLPPTGFRLPNGDPDLRPTAGYAGHYPVQFEDEADSTFAGRVAMFESSWATAQAIQSGGETFEGAVEKLDSRYDAELASLEVQRDANQLR